MSIRNDLLVSIVGAVGGWVRTPFNRNELLEDWLVGVGGYVPGYPAAWTPNFNGVNSYGQLLSAWQPTGADWEVEVDVYQGGNLDVAYLISSRTGGDSESFCMFKRTNGELAYRSDAASNKVYDDIGVANYFESIFNNSIITDSAPFGDITQIGANGAGAINLDGQIHNIKLTDLNDSSNSIEIDTVIRAQVMPTETELFNKLTGNKVGDLVNLGSTQPYVPQLKGGEVNRSYVAGKFEAYVGDLTNAGVGTLHGINITLKQLIAIDPTTSINGSSYPQRPIAVGDIVVAKNGAVLKGDLDIGAYSSQYTTLLGTDAQIQAGFEYPNVFRVLEPDVDVDSEYYWYNDLAGEYPWPG